MAGPIVSKMAGSLTGISFESIYIHIYVYRTANETKTSNHRGINHLGYPLFRGGKGGGRPKGRRKESSLGCEMAAFSQQRFPSDGWKFTS